MGGGGSYDWVFAIRIWLRLPIYASQRTDSVECRLRTNVGRISYVLYKIEHEKEYCCNSNTGKSTFYVLIFTL